MDFCTVYIFVDTRFAKMSRAGIGILCCFAIFGFVTGHIRK